MSLKCHEIERNHKRAVKHAMKLRYTIYMSLKCHKIEISHKHAVKTCHEIEIYDIHAVKNAQNFRYIATV
jgi:hypothetical protein